MNDFVERLDDALEAVIGRPGMSHAVMKRMVKEEKRKILNEQKRVMEGVYYWVPVMIGSKIDWTVEPFHEEIFGPNVSHPIMWDRYVVPLLVERFSKKEQATQMMDCAYGLPRGRIDKQVHGGYTLFHGNDTPPGHSLDEAMREFNFIARGRNKTQYEQHETMLRSNYECMETLLDVDLGLKEFKMHVE